MLDSGPYHPSAQEWLAEAAGETLRRIRADRAEAPDRVARLLHHLEGNVFDPRLDYEQLRHACQIRDHKTTSLFHAAVGRPPAAYIRECRLETAARLLSESPLEIWIVAELVGYSSIQAFGRAFKRWSDLAPSRYRSRHGSPAPTSGNDAAPSLKKSPRIKNARPSEEMVRQALIGELEDQEATTLVQQLAEIYVY